MFSAYVITMDTREGNNSATENTSESDVEVDNLEDNEEEDISGDIGLDVSTFPVSISQYPLNTYIFCSFLFVEQPLNYLFTRVMSDLLLKLFVAGVK